MIQRPSDSITRVAARLFFVCRHPKILGVVACVEIAPASFLASQLRDASGLDRMVQAHRSGFALHQAFRGVTFQEKLQRVLIYNGRVAVFLFALARIAFWREKDSEIFPVELFVVVSQHSGQRLLDVGRATACDRASRTPERELEDDNEEKETAVDVYKDWTLSDAAGATKKGGYQRENTNHNQSNGRCDEDDSGQCRVAWLRVAGAADGIEQHEMVWLVLVDKRGLCALLDAVAFYCFLKVARVQQAGDPLQVQVA